MQGYPRPEGPGRGFKNGYDYYETPRWVTDVVLNGAMGDEPKLLREANPLWFGERFTAEVFNEGLWYAKRPKTILEPCAGSGTMCEALHAWAPNAEITGLELDTRFIAEGETREEPWGTLIQADALAWLESTDKKFDLIITNPPYAHNFPARLFWQAIKRIEKGDHKHDGQGSYGAIALLLRAGWDSGKSRRDLLAEWNPNVVILGDRVNFNGKSNAPFVSAWYVWHGDNYWESRHLRHYR